MLRNLKKSLRKGAQFSIWKAASAIPDGITVETLYNGQDGNITSFRGKLFVDTLHGYVVSRTGHLFENTMQINLPNKRPARHGLASPLSFASTIRKEHRPDFDGPVVHLRHFWEWNYYHFFFDALAKLELYERELGPADLRLLGPYVDDIKFVRPVIDRWTGGGEFIVPRVDWVAVEEVRVIHTLSPYADRVRYLCQQLGVQSSGKDESLLYLERFVSRRIMNNDEVFATLSEYGFKRIDPGELSVDEQIDAFSRARYIVANHGAGTTNIIFRGDNPLSLLELHSDKWLAFDHKQICDEFEHTWMSLEGVSEPGPDQGANYTIDCDELRKSVEALLRT